MVGVGYWGKNLARNFAELGALGAVVDSNTAVAEAVSLQTGAAIRAFDDVLADPAINGVVIATRAETHFQLAKRALTAGKHVFVEKPLVLDEDEAEQLIAHAASVGRVLMVGHLLRYHPIFCRMLEIVQSGEYGRLRYVYSDRLSLGKIRTEEDVLWSFAPHDLSMVLALANAEPISVTAAGAAMVNAAIADFATLQLSFADGLKADIRASWLHFRKVQQIVAICDRATIVFEDSEPDWTRKLTVHPHQIAVDDAGYPVPQRGEKFHVDVPQAEPLKEECRHFLACISGEAQPATDGAEGRRVLSVLRRASVIMAGTKGESH